MRIVKISTETPSPADNLYSLLQKAIREDRVEWQMVPSGASSDAYASFTYRGFIKQTQQHSVNTKIHSFILQIDIYNQTMGLAVVPDGQMSMQAKVLLNQKRSLSIADHTKIWSFGVAVEAGDVKKTLATLLSSEFKIAKPPLLPGEEPDLGYPARTRLTRTKSRYHPATELVIFVEPIRLKRVFAIFFVVNNLETGERGEETKVSDTVPRNQIAEKVRQLIDEWCKSNGYVEKSEPEYIPEGSNLTNFDFVVNRPKRADVPNEPSTQPPPEEGRHTYKKLFAGKESWYKVSEGYDFGGYFSGDVPDSAANMWGTSAVDASQIKSLFGKADEAIKLVNQFDSSLLSPVSFIFNFGKSGAYGVYLSELDRAIKTKALQKQLESRGYKIEVNEQGLLTAYPTREEKNPEDIQRDIDAIYSQIQSKGSTAFGINMGAILDSSKQDAAQMNSPDPNVWEWIAILHLGSTITHEAIHAKGATDEGPAEAGGSRFLEFALPIVNREYEGSLKAQKKEDMFRPLTISTTTRHAQKIGWYRRAQSFMSMPKSVLDIPYGSDLSGRHPVGVQTDAGMAMWSMISQQNSTAPIENKLGRQYVFPLYPDINPNKDSIEEQLRKSTKHVKRIDPKSSMEEVLSEGHDPNRGYQSLEQLLDEIRVKPLIVPLKKSASLVKIATLFGWMNNLEISDGSTIPGLGDRVMAWDDRDEDFAEEESWIRKQPRYNPTYDIKGFYYRWIEPRFQPQLFDDMTRDYPGTHPAKRFASNGDDVSRIMEVFEAAKHKIKSGEISGTRFIMTEDVLPIVEKVFASCDCSISIFYYAKSEGDEDIYAVWVFTPTIGEGDIERIEKHFQNKNADNEQDVLGLIEQITGIDAQKQSVIDSILKQIEEIGRDYGVSRMSFGKNLHVLDNGTIVLNFSNMGQDLFLKIGSLLSEALGSKDVYMEADRVILVYKGYQVSMVNNKESQDELV